MVLTELFCQEVVSRGRTEYATVMDMFCFCCIKEIGEKGKTKVLDILLMVVAANYTRQALPIR